MSAARKFAPLRAGLCILQWSGWDMAEQIELDRVPVKEPAKEPRWKNRWLAKAHATSICLICGSPGSHEPGDEVASCCRVHATKDDAEAFGRAAGNSHWAYLGPIQVPA